MLRTQSILAPFESTDGLRISVTSRHTLNDGISPHPNIQPSSYDYWLPLLAPPPQLVGDYYKRGLPWSEFENRYLDHLNRPEIQILVRGLGNFAIEQDVTIMCVEDSPQYCHRRLLAEEAQQLVPDLTLHIM